MNERPLVAIARGGYSDESVVSMKSAQQMMIAVDKQLFEPIFITITRSSWEAFDLNEKPLLFDRGSMHVNGKPIEGVLIAIHGTPGEDGSLQGYLDMLQIPYQTGDVLNMSLTFSKYATTGLLRQLGFPVAKSVLINSHTQLDQDDLLAEVGLPCFVKPDRSGSSLGISKVKTANELDVALKLAFTESTMVMVESAVKGRELTCGVIEFAGEIKAMPLCEVKTDREYFDYEAKYHATGTEEILPADIPDNLTKLIQERSVDIYNAFGCKGMVRIDYFWTGSDLITIEINSVPGFSAESIFPKMLHVDGMGLEKAVNGLIQEMLK